MKQIKITIILLAAVFSLEARSSGNDGLWTEILSNNPELQAARNAKDGEAEALKSENNLADPEVELEYMFTRHPGRSLELTATQEFDWPGIYGARKKQTAHLISAMDYLYREKEQEILLQARTTVADIRWLDKRIHLRRQLRNRNKELLRGYQLGTKEGEFTILDINKLKVAIADIDAELADLETQRSVALSGFVSLNGGKMPADTSELSSAKEGALLPLEEYSTGYRSNNPGYLAAVQQSLAASRSMDVAKMSRLPKFSLGYKFQREEGEKASGFIVGVSIPIFSGRHKAKAAYFSSESARFAATGRQLEGEVRLQATYNSVLSLDKTIDVYRESVEDPRNKAVLEQALNGGQMTLLSYLTELNYLTEASDRLYEMEYRRSIGMATLEVLSGCSSR